MEGKDGVTANTLDVVSKERRWEIRKWESYKGTGELSAKVEKVKSII